MKHLKKFNFEWQYHHAATAVRDDVLEKISYDKKWKWLEGTALDLKQLCFSGHSQSDELWRFGIYDFNREEHVGYGALTKNNSSKAPFHDYLFLVLSDGMTVEAWTDNKEKSTTNICLNGQIVGHIKSYWKKFLFEWLCWQEKWDIF